jgi:hypothetical protein
MPWSEDFPMEMKRGTLQAFDSGTYTATVEVAGSISVWLTGVPVARNIASAELVSGRKVALLLFDSANPKDIVLTAVWT